jgi:guanylate kinase
METTKNSPIVISGPSGAGKTELIEYIEKKNSLFLEATGYTTREKRKIETGKMYFIKNNEFEQLIRNDELIEYCIYNGNYYGIAKKEFEKLKDNYLIFNVGYSSAKVIKDMYHNSFMIYLLPPTKEELLRRLGDRDYQRYLIGIEETMKHALEYEYLLISQTNDFERTFNDFMDIFEQKSTSNEKKLILAKNKDFINGFYK